MRHALAFATVTLVACAHPQLAYRFEAPSAGPEPLLPKLSRALAAQGQQVLSVDDQAGVLYTRWQDTGFMYGQIQNAPANIVRRYVVTVQPGAVAQVQVRQESQRCGQGQFSIGDQGVQGACVAMDGLVEKHQHELDTLGAQLQAAAK